jgi:hypothetical protein
VDQHPGGDIIKEFNGQDATVPFLAMHDEHKVLKHRRPCGEYAWDPAAPSGLPSEGEWIRLHDEFKAEGLFEKDMPWYYRKVLLCFSFLFLALALVKATLAADVAGYVTASKVTFVLAALALSEFWHQCGFFMHDMMHRHIFDDLKTNHNWAWLFANVGMGVSRKWWRDDHIEHHVFPNTVVSGVGPTDPQAAEEVWAGPNFRSVSLGFPVLTDAKKQWGCVGWGGCVGATRASSQARAGGARGRCRHSPAGRVATLCARGRY